MLNSRVANPYYFLTHSFFQLCSTPQVYLFPTPGPILAQAVPRLLYPELEPMATRLVAQLIVMGSGVVMRAVSQAYRQAIVNANRTGVAQEAVQSMSRKMMTEHEARQILGVPEHSPWEDVVTKYETLFENNMKRGSFYLQSKVVRAKECLEAAKLQQA